MSHKPFYTLLVMCNVIRLDIWIDFGCRSDFCFCRQGNYRTEAMQSGQDSTGSLATYPCHAINNTQAEKNGGKGSFEIEPAKT